MFKMMKILILLFVVYSTSQAQFYDTFDGPGINGWFAFTGDGQAKVSLQQKDGYLRIYVDASNDLYNVWWAVSKRNAAKYLDLSKLKDPAYEVRVEARVRVSKAPRRINMMVNTQRTTNFHKDLMEFDIPDTSGWHIISMTTKDLDAVPGDSLFVQLNVIDWGIGKYHVDMDYYRADIINVADAGPDKGVQVPYHPPIPALSVFEEQIPVTHDALINMDFPDVNFNNWQVNDTMVLTVNARQWAILRWDLSEFKNKEISGAGLLELTTHSVFKGGDYNTAFGEDLGMEFGKVRIVEIFGGDPIWDQQKVTYNNLLQGKDLYAVINSQMVYDCELSDENGAKNYITIPEPVMQRLIDGTTKGLLIRPLGAIDASFYASEYQLGQNSAILFFNIAKKSN